MCVCGGGGVFSGDRETHMHPTYLASNKVTLTSDPWLCWCTQNMRREDSCFTLRQLCNNQRALYREKRAMQSYSHSFHSHIQLERSGSGRE